MASNTGLRWESTWRRGSATGSRSRLRSAWPPSRRSRNGRFSKVRHLPGGAAERIALAQQHCSPDRSDNLSRALRAMEQAPDAAAAQARELRLVTVFNTYESGGGGRCYDSSPVFDADGALLGVTRMLHITDYACFHERAYYAPGDRGAPVYPTRVGRVGVAICYDRQDRKRPRLNFTAT